MSNVTRRLALGGAAALAMPAIVRAQGTSQPRTLRISHQFPASNGATGDFRDRMCHRFADGVSAKTNGSLKFEIYPNASLMKTFAQFSGLRKGALDIALIPLTYAGGEVHELQHQLHARAGHQLRPGLRLARPPRSARSLWHCCSGAEGHRARQLDVAVRRHGVPHHSRSSNPADAKGMKIRGGSREMDEMFLAAGASVSSSMPSNEVYMGMKTGVMDAACTSSSSFLSFKLEETCKFITTPGATAASSLSWSRSWCPSPCGTR